MNSIYQHGNARTLNESIHGHLTSSHAVTVGAGSYSSAAWDAPGTVKFPSASWVGELAEAYDTRCRWEATTEPTRRLARAADIEFKRRGVRSSDDHLRSAEPEGFAYPERYRARQVWVQPRLDGSIDVRGRPTRGGRPELARRRPAQTERGDHRE